MNRIQSILRGAMSIFDFRWLVMPGQCDLPRFFNMSELPTLRSPGDAIASYWQATGDYIRIGMEHVQSEEGNGNGKESQE